MDSERWHRVATLYQHACELPATERILFLDDACNGDRELRLEVESLLSEDVSAHGPLERVAEHVETARPHPIVVGPYRIVAALGEGGMATVYKAEQQHPRRIVALKMLKSSLAGAEPKRRFALECEALGRLQHPGVAQIYEAGVSDTPLGSQPYFAMEFIRGSSLLGHARSKNLDTARRIELMIRICEAVQHAHERGIIHRDLKPANILVDETGQPKILDFGIARITDLDPHATRHTSMGDLLGTVPYMSPEQFLADQSTIDTRTDIYSLGVILYELLCGQRPYELGQQLPEVARIVREQEPVALGAVRRELRGDLETIVAKALEKEKTRRYASAAELAADLRRYLANEPIVAKPASRLYRAGKFMRRHRALVSSAMMVLLILVAGIVVTTREAIQAARERDRALRAEHVASAVNEFLQKDLLAQAGSRAQAVSRATPDPNLKVRTALDRAAARIIGKFDFDPAVEASIRRTIGLAYVDMNLFSEAQPQLERAAELRKRALGFEDADTLTSLDELGTLYNLQGKYPAAEALLGHVVASRRRVLGESHADTLATMSNLALAISYEGDDTRAAPMFVKVLEGDRRVLGEENRATLSVLDNLASAYLRTGRFGEAATLLERELELNRRVLGPEHPDTINSMHNLASAYRDLGKYSQADALFSSVWQARRKALGEDHWETQNTRYSLAISYRAQGRYADAEKLFKDSAESLARTMGPEHPISLKPLYHLAKVYFAEQKFAEAGPLFARVLDVRRRVLGTENLYTAEVEASLGEMKLQQGLYREADKLLAEALRVRSAKKPQGWERYYTESMLGACRAKIGDVAESRALLRSGHEGLLRNQDSIPAEYRSVVDRAAKWIRESL